MKINQAPSSIWIHPLQFIAFGFGSGAIPFAPGTFGTLVAIPFYLMLQPLSLTSYLLILILAILGSIWLCDKVEKTIGEHDHAGMNIDEIVGYGMTMIAAPHGWKWVLLGFILFRIFDIWKPQPIRWVDKHVQGGLGVIVDDLLAAIPAWIILQLIAWIILR